jgi:hypothetical protein
MTEATPEQIVAFMMGGRMSDIVERLDDLIKQATIERSHFYVAKCAKDAKAEIARLREGRDTMGNLWAAAKAEIERLMAAFAHAVGRATTDADLVGEPMMLAVAHAQRIARMEADNERLEATMSILADNFIHGWAGETRSDTIRNVEVIARRTLESKPTDAQLARYHGDVDGDGEP